MRTALVVAGVLAAVAPVLSGQVVDLAKVRMVDLTHSLNAGTLYWPNSPSGFDFEQLSYGETEGGWFYSANRIRTPEHGGTHLDAPIHFFRGGHTVDQIPLRNLIAPAVVIDVTAAAAQDPDYLLTADDVRAFEAEHGVIPGGAMVLLRTGWSRRWPDAKEYLGDDTPGDTANLHFPSFGPDAAQLLVQERGVVALGADVASIDHGPSADFRVHRIAAGANVPGLENLTRLEELPPTGAVVLALPVKIEGGSGSPARVVALIPRGQDS